MTDKISVKVAVRIRPLVNSEIDKGSKNILEVFNPEQQVRLLNSDKAFSFNYVFGDETPQALIYENAIKKMIDNLFNGYNVTILAYGQTGSGKTHTMGTTYDGSGEMGIIPRAVVDIFERIKDQFSNDYEVSVSFMEIYQETLYDLLSGKERDQCVLDIREDPVKGVLTPGLTELGVKNQADVLNALLKGSKGRATASTNMNAQSSRSHAIFTVNITMMDRADRTAKTAKFHLVDLAGSERPKKTGAVGNTFKEGVNINKGLLVLGNVISALGDEKQKNGFIPYRDSNLTRILKDSLGGNSITLMIACVSPADYNMDETISTLRYADRARKIQNKPVVNQDPNTAKINKLKQEIQDLKLQIIGQGGPIACSEEVLNALKEENRLLQVKIRDLTVHLSTTLHDKTGLLERIMILQNANDVLHNKIIDLKTQYDVIIAEFETKMEGNCPDGVVETIKKLTTMQEHFLDINDEQKKTESAILTHEKSLDLHQTQTRLSRENSMNLSKNDEIYANKQMALNNELEEVNKYLAMKEDLARQISANTEHVVDYSLMAENEANIIKLTTEKDELVKQSKYTTGVNAKLAEQRRKRLQELEIQIQDLKKKVQEQSRLIKLKEKDLAKVNVLNKEILQMKQTRVKLIKKMRDESELFRAYKLERKRELLKLKQEDCKKQNKIIKMEIMHNKQQNVLKRKVEEAAALNKRLKDALALRKATHDMKAAGKSEKIGTWIKQEIAVHLHLIEAEATLAVLLEDRATLQRQLDTLKNSSEKDEEQIVNLEADIELRSVQIQDLQQKLFDSKDEGKTTKFDNIQTMGDCKHALKVVLEQAGDLKRDHIGLNTKLIESQASLNEVQQGKLLLEKNLKALDSKHCLEVANLQKDYEEKIAILLRQLRGVEMLNASEELQQRCAIQCQQIEELERKNEELLEQVAEAKKDTENLHQTLNMITIAKTESFVEEIAKTEPFVEQTAKTEQNNFRTPERRQSLDISMEDDIDNDPDWRKTPMGKWILRQSRKLPTKAEPVKRTSEGGCACNGRCIKRCTCRKGKVNCSLSCKCRNVECTNRLSSSLDDSNESQGEKRRKVLDRLSWE